MHAKIKIDLDNSAFSDEELGPEIGRILKNLGERIEEQCRAYLETYTDENARGFRLADINGNTVGFCTLHDD